jgi:hypothetical protein
MFRHLICGVAVGLATLPAFSAQPDSDVDRSQRRGVEQTFLTYPEWFLVHSPAEYASYVGTHPSHDFPFVGHIQQLWSGYAIVTREQMKNDYPKNFGYHVMINVIALSTTAEYAIRAAYENTLGRISWAAAGGNMTEEDRYAARQAQAYVDFIRVEPWYLFDFKSCLLGLWKENPAVGEHMIRKWERRYALTTEYSIKFVYGKIIEKATRAAYVPALMTTQAVIEKPPTRLPSTVKLVKRLDDGAEVIDMPRYYNFRIAATELAKRGSTFRDIAGNQSVILVTAWARDGHPDLPSDHRILFEQPLLTTPGNRRLGIVLPVAKLSALLANAAKLGLQIEHVYDY